MPGSMTLQVITPERTVLKQVETDAVVVPVTDGSMGILYNHAPMVATLRIGVLRYKSGERYEKVAVTGGFMELSDNRITVLADAAETADSIDVMRAKQAKARAEARLRDRSREIDRARAQSSLQRAVTRLRTAGVIESFRDQ
jgi:F-type H+-transporting ATPase subunit epsilon